MNISFIMIYFFRSDHILIREVSVRNYIQWWEVAEDVKFRLVCVFACDHVRSLTHPLQFQGNLVFSLDFLSVFIGNSAIPSVQIPT